jgi:hypothetical protein
MKKIYVAGSYNADNIVAALDNMRIGMRKGLEVLLEGFIPFVPWFDYHFQLMLRDGETLTKEDYYKYSIEWLKVCDALLVVNYRNGSVGTQMEIDYAKEHNIPVFFSIEELKEWANSFK